MSVPTAESPAAAAADLACCGADHVMTTGKDDLTKATQLGSKMGGTPPVTTNPADWPYPGCPQCKPGDGQWHLKELGFSDALRYSGKMDVVDKPDPHEMYGFCKRRPTCVFCGLL